MQWRQIDFNRRLIIVDRALKSRTGIEVGLPKWNRNRTTFLPQKAMDALKPLRRQSDFVLPEALCFCYPDGSMRGHTWWTGAFNRAMQRAGIDKKAKNITAHSLRHSANTLLLDAGLDPGKIRAAMGWQGEEIQSQYTHYAEMSLEELSDAMDKILET